MSNYQFHVGQKVVHIHCPNVRVFTINEIVQSSCACRKKILLSFEGISTEATGCQTCFASNGRALWRADMYRPLDSLTEQVERIEKEGAPVELQTVEA